MHRLFCRRVFLITMRTASASRGKFQSGDFSSCVFMFPSPGPVPELSPGCSSPQLPPPQPERPEVLPPRQVTHSPSRLRRACQMSNGSAPSTNAVMLDYPIWFGFFFFFCSCTVSGFQVVLWLRSAVLMFMCIFDFYATSNYVLL